MLSFLLAPVRWIAHSKLRYMYFGGTYDPVVPSDRSALQRHVDFFAEDDQRILTIGMTSRGLKRLGIKLPFLPTWIAALAIHLAVGNRTWQTWLPVLTVNTDAIALAIHGNATRIFMPSGEMNLERMDSWWNEYSDGGGGITKEGLANLMRAKREPIRGLSSLQDRLFASSELPVIFNLLGGDVITRERWEQLYDGSLFYCLTEDRDCEVAAVSR